jgi:uncharacterized protein YjiS (DUF1127 family)
MAAVVFALAVVVLRWGQRQQTRRALNHLDGRLLTDIGLTAQGASLEGKKPPGSARPPRQTNHPNAKRLANTAGLPVCAKSWISAWLFVKFDNSLFIDAFLTTKITCKLPATTFGALRLLSKPFAPLLFITPSIVSTSSPPAAAVYKA